MAQVYGVKSNATRGAVRALKALGVKAPKSGEDFEVVACEGGWYFIDLRPEAVEAAGAENTADIEVAACLSAAKEQAEIDACKVPVIDTGTYIHNAPEGFYENPPVEIKVMLSDAPTEGPAHPVVDAVIVHSSGVALSDIEGTTLSTKPFDESAATFAELFPNGVTLKTAVSPEDGSMHDDVEALPLVEAAMVDDGVIAAIYAMGAARATRPAAKKSRGWMAFYEREVEAGRMPPRHLVTSICNMHWQTHFDALHKMAATHNREGLLAYPLNGKNSYAQDCRRWRDVLVKAVDKLAPAAPVAAAA